MSDRCIVRVKYTPAGGDAAVRRVVSGFVRYIQHRDLHPSAPPGGESAQIAGLVKYIAYRDQAAMRAELFGSHGHHGTPGRKAFVEFVARSINDSQPQLFRTREGRVLDRRRAVSRLIISPEQSQDLDLERLTKAAMARFADEIGADLRWIAAIHRNTAHHHIHLVVAGMRQDAAGAYHRVDITKPRLAAIKQAVANEIQRQRGERMQALDRPLEKQAKSTDRLRRPVAGSPIIRSAAGSLPALAPQSTSRLIKRQRRIATSTSYSLLRLRAAARRYQRLLERDSEQEIRRCNWDLVA